MHVSAAAEIRSVAREVDRALANYLATIIGSSRALLRERAHDEALRREIQDIHDAADAAVHLISKSASAADARGDQELRALERAHIVRVLADLGGNKLATAKRLGISRRTLYRRLARHGLTTPASGLTP